MLNIFDQYGKILRPTDEAIAALDDDIRAKLFECIAAVTARDEGQARASAARADVRAKDAVYNAALAADQKANPPATFKSALMAVVAATNGHKPEPVRVNKKTRAALAEAEMVLAEARSELTRATTELRTLEAEAGECTNRWRLAGTTPSADETRREYMAASLAERAKRVAAGLSAEAPKIQPAHQSELDRVFAARGKVANRLPQFMGKR